MCALGQILCFVAAGLITIFLNHNCCTQNCSTLFWLFIPFCASTSFLDIIFHFYGDGHFVLALNHVRSYFWITAFISSVALEEPHDSSWLLTFYFNFCLHSQLQYNHCQQDWKLIMFSFPLAEFTHKPPWGLPRQLYRKSLVYEVNVAR